MERTLKQALEQHGYTCERVYSEGYFKGMRVLKDVVQVHDNKVLSADGGWDLIHSLEK